MGHVPSSGTNPKKSCNPLAISVEKHLRRVRGLVVPTLAFPGVSPSSVRPQVAGRPDIHPRRPLTNQVNGARVDFSAPSRRAVTRRDERAFAQKPERLRSSPIQLRTDQRPMWRRSARFPFINQRASASSVADGQEFLCPQHFPAAYSGRLCLLPRSSRWPPCGSGSDADGGDGAWGAGPPPLHGRHDRQGTVHSQHRRPARPYRSGAHGGGSRTLRRRSSSTTSIRKAPMWWKRAPCFASIRATSMPRWIRRGRDAAPRRGRAHQCQQIVRRYAPLVADQSVSALKSTRHKRPCGRTPMSRTHGRPLRGRSLAGSTVRAPIAGRVGRAQVTEGALVSASSAAPACHG